MRKTRYTGEMPNGHAMRNWKWMPARDIAVGDVILIVGHEGEALTTLPGFDSWQKVSRVEHIEYRESVGVSLEFATHLSWIPTLDGHRAVMVAIL